MDIMMLLPLLAATTTDDNDDDDDRRVMGYRELGHTHYRAANPTLARSIPTTFCVKQFHSLRSSIDLTATHHNCIHFEVHEVLHFGCHFS